MGVEAFRAEMAGREAEMDTLLAMFEDEALNCELSATLVSAYLKKHLGYGEKTEAPRGSCQTEGLKLVFDHDIWEDGG